MGHLYPFAVPAQIAGRPEPHAAIVETIGEVAGAARGRGRTDLAARLEASADRLRTGTSRILVAGDYKQGKSALTNALVGRRVCPTDDDLATTVPLTVQPSPESAVTVVLHPDPSEPPANVHPPIDGLADYVTEAGNPGNVRGVVAALVEVPMGGGTRHISYIDSPGTGGIQSPAGSATLAAVPYVDSVVFVSDASQELTADEIDFLGAVRGVPLVCALTKIDLYPSWRKVAALNREHLDERAIAAEIVPVSSELAALAAQAGADAAVEGESGFPDLHTAIAVLVAGVRERTAVAVRDEVSGVIAQLESELLAEQEAADPQRGEAVVAELDAALRQAEANAGAQARWLRVLDDGAADIRGEAQRDLRDRMRALVQEAELTLEDADPAEIWDQFEPWLDSRTSAEVAECCQGLTARAMALAGEVESHLATAEAELLVPLDIGAPTAAIEVLRADARLAGSAGAEERGLMALQKGWGSVEALTVFGASVAGLGILMPVSLVIALVVGGRALRKEKSRQLEARRDRAKEEVRRYVEEVRAEIEGDIEQALRTFHREMRDASNGRAEELIRSLQDALTAARRQTGERGKVEAQARADEVATQLGRLGDMRALLVDGRA